MYSWKVYKYSWKIAVILYFQKIFATFGAHARHIQANFDVINSECPHSWSHRRFYWKANFGIYTEELQFKLKMQNNNENIVRNN